MFLRFVEVGRLLNISFCSEILPHFSMSSKPQHNMRSSLSFFTVFSLLEIVLFFNGIFRRGRTKIFLALYAGYFPLAKHLSGSISKLERRSER